MQEMNQEIVLASIRDKVRVLNDCWLWIGDGREFQGFYAGDLIYGSARGLIGRGATLTKCEIYPTCVNPWHRQATYMKIHRVYCRRGHKLNENGKCPECWRIDKAKWRAKLPKRSSSVTS